MRFDLVYAFLLLRTTSLHRFITQEMKMNETQAQASNCIIRLSWKKDIRGKCRIPLTSSHSHIRVSVVHFTSA